MIAFDIVVPNDKVVAKKHWKNSLIKLKLKGRLREIHRYFFARGPPLLFWFFPTASDGDPRSDLRRVKISPSASNIAFSASNIGPKMEHFTLIG